MLAVCVETGVSVGSPCWPSVFSAASPVLKLQICTTTQAMMGFIAGQTSQAWRSFGVKGICLVTPYCSVLLGLSLKMTQPKDPFSNPKGK